MTLLLDEFIDLAVRRRQSCVASRQFFVLR
jgi:hypothetical protein